MTNSYKDRFRNNNPQTLAQYGGHPARKPACDACHSAKQKVWSRFLILTVCPLDSPSYTRFLLPALTPHDSASSQMDRIPAKGATKGNFSVVSTFYSPTLSQLIHYLALDVDPGAAGGS